MFQSLLDRRAANRAYKQAIDNYLSVLFRGFPEGLLPSLRQRVGDAGLVRQGHAAGTDARACSVQVAILLIREILDPLSSQERQDVARAFLRNDAGNPTYKGFKYMLRVVEHLHVPPALVTYLNTEVAGHLRGMSQKAIFNAWVDAQIGGVMDRLRARCLAEADSSQTSERETTRHAMKRDGLPLASSRTKDAGIVRRCVTYCTNPSPGDNPSACNSDIESERHDHRARPHAFPRRSVPLLQTDVHSCCSENESV